MNAALISIGDELLIGKTINTNSAWLGEHLSAVGFNIHCVETIGDERQQIIETLTRLTADNEIVIITGGLGPTNDDITKLVLCEFYQTELEFNQQAYDGMARYVYARNQEINEKNLTQAQFPKTARLVPNPCGTASGMWFEKNGRVVVSLPGVPYEMKDMMTESVIPWLQEKFELPAMYHRHIIVTNIAESKLAEMISDWENQLPKQIHLAYLPVPGLVKLRMSCTAETQERAHELVAQEEQKLRAIINQYICAFDDETMEQRVGALLLKHHATVSTAESCTGGNISRSLTRVSGSSAYYWGSIISYDNSVKVNQLNVDQQIIEQFGVVSEQVVKTMATEVRKKLGTTYGVATSGIVGPSGGSNEKPVGTVWIAVASDCNVIAQKFLFEKNRERNMDRATVAALVMLQNLILSEHNETI